MQTAVIHQLPVDSLRGRRVLVRIAGDEISAHLLTLRYVLQAGSRIIVGTHADEPGTLVEELERLLERPVCALSSALGRETRRAVMEMKPREILALPNLGRYSGEAANDPAFASELASLADVYCDDAFSIAALALASTVGITRFVPTSVAGLEMARVIALIKAVTTEPENPFVALVGGTGLEGKLPLLEQLVGKTNRLFIGGAISFTFLKAQRRE